MSNAAVVIDLSTSRLVAAHVRRGVAISVCSEALNGIDWKSPWPASLARLDPVLARLVQTLGATDQPATIICSAPGFSATIASCASGAGVAGARVSARLALAASTPFPIDDHPCSTEVLHIDRHVASPSDAGAPLPPLQIHTLAMALEEHAAEALHAWGSRAGLRVVRLLPSEAVGMARAVAMAMHAPSSESFTAGLWLGEDEAILAAGGRGRLRFVRKVGFGVQSLVEGLTRPIRPRDPEAPTVTLSHEDARALLLSVGVPSAEQQVPGLRGVDGSVLLPMLQPVLQRAGLDVKQSLRFGLAESERTSTRLVSAGPGAHVPNVARVIAAQAGLTLHDPATAGAASANSQDSRLVTVDAWVSGGRPVSALLPLRIHGERAVSRTRALLYAGVLLGAGLIGADWWLTRQELDRERARAQDLQLKQGTGTAREAADGLRRAMAALDDRIGLRMGANAEWPTLLRVIGEIAPANLRLSNIEITATARDGPEAQLSGFATNVPGLHGVPTIRQFIESLQALPIVSGVKLESAQRAASKGHEGQRFVIGLRAVALPVSLSPPAQASAIAPTDGDTP